MAHAQNRAQSTARGIAGTLTVIGYRLASRLFPGWLWTLPPSSGKLAITFDDGPDPKTTARLLRALREYSIASTMFLTGARCTDPALLRDIAAQGHAAANHGYEHRPHALRSAEAQRDSILRTEEVLRNAGVDIHRLFRPPFGSFDWKTGRIAKDCGYRGVMWSLMARDWKPQSAETLWDKVHSRLHPGAIILLHDGHETTETVIQILPRLAEFVAARGWEFTLL